MWPDGDELAKAKIPVVTALPSQRERNATSQGSGFQTELGSVLLWYASALSGLPDEDLESSVLLSRCWITQWGNGNGCEVGRI
jgi:hypothetical protein